MKALHHEKLPVNGIVELIYKRRRPGNRRIRKQNLPPRLFSRYPSAYPLPILFARETFNLLTEPSQPLTQRSVVRRFASFVDEKDPPKLPTERLTYGFSHPFDLAGQLEGCV